MHFSSIFYKIRSFVLQQLSRINPPFVLGRFGSEFLAKHIEPMTYFRYWFVNPMNGQSRRIFTFYGLVHRLKPTVAIETGTFYGSSTLLFLGLNVQKVFSVEVDASFAKVAKSRFKQSEDEGLLEICIGKSEDVLKTILAKLDKSQKIIAYLDAHWDGDIPTIREIELLCEWGGAWIAVIDDFKHEQFSEYGFDVYGGIAVGVGILEFDKQYEVFLPNEAPVRETGAKRGTAFLVSKKAKDFMGEEFDTDLPISKYLFDRLN